MKKVKDHYFNKAKKQGFAARSVYKLEEIDQRHTLLKKNMQVLDLGSAPGSWLQYVASQIGPGGRVVGVDLNPVEITLPPQGRAITGDVFDLTPEQLGAELGEENWQVDLILSDMAPKTTGIPSADAARSANLVWRTLELSSLFLKPGGDLLVKAFQGSAFNELRNAFKAQFEKMTVEKPKATRSESVEIFLLGRGFKENS